MSSAQDPFYIVKEEIQDSIVKLLSSFHRWEHVPPDSGEQINLTKELLTNCESIEWQKVVQNSAHIEGISPSSLVHVTSRNKRNMSTSLISQANKSAVGVDELDKTISVAARNPSLYGINEVELEKRRRWTSNARAQVGNVKKQVVAGKEFNGLSSSNVNGMRRELMRLPNHPTDRSSQYNVQASDDLISSESDRQLLLIKQQDEELDELSASVERIGGVGLTIHEELLAQDRIIGDLGTEMESTSDRLDFVQKKVAMVMKKAGAKGQYMMILFLLVLFVILFVLVFIT